MNINQLLPHSRDAEIGLLGSCFASPKAVGAICAQRRVMPDDFHIPHHADLFRVLMELWSSGSPQIDFVSVSEKLKSRDQWCQEMVPSLSEIMSFPTAAATDYYIDLVKEKAALRALSRECRRFAESAVANGADLQTVAIAQTAIAAIGTRCEVKRTPLRELLIEVVGDIEAGRGEGVSILSGIAALDDDVSMRAGDFIVICGEAKSGKTALAGNIACHAAVRQEKRVLMFSLEMTAKELVGRFLASEGRVNLAMIGTTVSEREMQGVTRGVTALQNAKLEVVSDAFDLSAILATARQEHCREPLALVVVDYLQLVEASTGRKGETRQEAVAQVSRSCKRLAQELGCVLIGLSQLNDDGRLRESRAIGQDANAVLAVEKSSDGGRLIRVVAQRSGPSGVSLPVQWLPQFTRFQDL